jgi:hypothetical protein
MKKVILVALFAVADSPGLPPVHATKGGSYFTPGCDRYSELPEGNRIPTAQEAELRGYRPAGACIELAGLRIEQEIQLLGRMEATPETERQKADLLRHRELERKNQEIEAKQMDLEDRQDEIERKLDQDRIERILD